MIRRRGRESDGDKATQLLAESSHHRRFQGRQGRHRADHRDQPRDEDWTAFLLNKGADPNLGGKGGDTPLIAAARVGFEDAAEWLLGRGQGRRDQPDGRDAADRRGPAAPDSDGPAAARIRANPDKTDTAARLFGARLCDARQSRRARSSS
jgi:ankyrin repeat protein